MDTCSFYVNGRYWKESRVEFNDKRFGKIMAAVKSVPIQVFSKMMEPDFARQSHAKLCLFLHDRSNNGFWLHDPEIYIGSGNQLCWIGEDKS
jgi:hypothetical protein